MNLVAAAAAFVIALFLVLAGVTRISVWLVERRNPPSGGFVTVNGARIHYVHVPPGARAELPPVVFIHGATANMKDQMVPLRPVLEGRAEMLFFDRPGHGWSDRGAGNETPKGQADTIAALMKSVGIERAIIVSHSFGGSIAAALALEHPEMVGGLVFLSPATHPWPGGRTTWYYRLTNIPLIGWAFSETVANPAASQRMPNATVCVFAPNPAPDRYLERTSIPLIVRPATFRANAVDVESLYPFATANAGRYSSIKAPTVVISGDSDTVVYEEIHSLGLVRDIPGAELAWVRNLGHKPDWVASDLVVAAIEKTAGRSGDVQAAVRVVEARIAADSVGKTVCVDDPAPATELAPQ
jgi:pimeloyl-ACP methyl ester carboxylesterase